MALIGDDTYDADSPLSGPSSRSSSVAPGATDEVDDSIHSETAQKTPARPEGNPSLDEEEDENEFLEVDERENRFQGSSSTWRFFTENERALATSIDQQRANDLSIHLYNAHALKRRVRDPEAASKVKLHHSKKRWIKPNEDGTLPWHPDAAWTAWPLKPEEVPRSGERFGVPVFDEDADVETYRIKRDWRLSDDLEGEIQAIMLRKAKERLRDDPHDLTVLLEDEEATKVLQPSVSRVVSQLDNLLIGLHKNRRGHMRNSSSSRPKRRRLGSTVPAKRTNSTRRFKSRIKIQSSGFESSDTEADASDYASDQDTRSEKQGNDKPKRQRPLNPRDWSEVLGIASLVGWDAAVVDRAARRCASLFGEGMEFRTISKSDSDKKANGGAPSAQAPGESRHLDFIVDDEPAASPYNCPVEDCNRHEQPYPLAWRWREHLKRKHNYSKERVKQLEASLKDETEFAAED